jgi:hypothetical protein
MPTNTQEILWGQSWNRGNYVQAYKTQDFAIAQFHTILSCERSAYEQKVKNLEKILQHAFTLGFFASYEEHEIPIKYRAPYRYAKVFARKNGFALGID